MSPFLGKQPTTVAVIVRNDHFGLWRLLQSLSRTFRRSRKSWPILIIDNASAAPFVSALYRLPEEFPDLDLQFIFREENSISGARQQALDFARTEWVTFLEPNFCVTARWAEYCEKWMKVLRHDPNVWAWGGPAIFKGKDPLEVIKQGFRALLPSRKWTSTYRSVKYIPNSQIFLKTSIIRGLGGFPKGYDRIGEDLALSLLIRSLGGKLFQVDRPRVFHIQKTSPMSYLKRLFQYGESVGQLARKNPSRFLSPDFLPVYALGVSGATAIFIPLQILTLFLSAIGFLIVVLMGNTASFRKSIGSVAFALSALVVFAAASIKGLVGRGLG
jgi:hypothetical protein